MKKFLGILVAVMLCVCAVAPAASASAGFDISALSDALGGMDLSNLSADEIANTLGLDLGELDAVLSELENAGSSDSVDAIMSKLGLGTDGSEAPAAGSSASAGGFDLSSLGDMLGGIDLSGITDSLSSGFDLSSITSMFEGIDMSSFDLSSLTDMIGGVFGDSGFDLSSITSGLDLGSFDISSILGGLGDIGGGSSEGGSTAGGSSSPDEGISSVLSGLADSLTSGLSSLGLDTSTIEGLLDNDIVNFFANLYIGLGKVGGDEPEDTTAATTAAPTTKAPSTTKATPNTGDASQVFTAIAVLSVASAAAFVCLKKNKVED